MSLIPTKTMPIAIIGMGCRFPQDANTPKKLWDLCSAGGNTWSDWPKSRMNEDGFYHPRAENLGTIHSRGGHFIREDVSLFDAHFFNFTADMVKGMDPQIRFLLETVFEALESAGISLEEIAGTSTSVFAGAMFHDYQDMLMQDVDNLPRYYLTGNAPAMVANSVSHFFDLRGPSITVDTACSTAMTALHLACQSIRTGDSGMAIVGGANLILYPSSSIGLSNLGLTGPSGKSFGFDSRAEGYGRGEGVGCIILKSLSAAIRDKDPIRAVIRETGMNQDGHTPTVTSPSQEAQESLIRSCYEKAGLDPLDTAYVESHGTGTIAGDTIEVKSLGNVFGRGRSMEDPLFIGSIKANIGHTESASGIAAVIKVIQMLENDSIPPQALFSNSNPGIDFVGLNIKVPKRLIPWPEDTIRRVSVNNFGAGGTNTHAIIESIRYHKKPAHKNTKTENGGSGAQLNGNANGDIKISLDNAVQHLDYLFPISAKDEQSGRAAAHSLAGYLTAAGPDIEKRFHDLAYTLSLRRAHFSWRLATSARSITELQEALENPQLMPAQTSLLKVPRLGFVFTGQGAQWYAMGRELVAAYPVFRAAMTRAETRLKSLGSTWSVLEELSRDKASSKLDLPSLSFPCTVIIQLALVLLLSSWGIVPNAATGHSSGEIAAAYAAGFLTFEEAIAVAYVRGKLTSSYIESGQIHGGMAALETSPEEAAEYLKDLTSGSAVIACVNSPFNVTIAGDITALAQVEARAVSKQVFYRRLNVPAAYHSPQMELISEEYDTQLTFHLGKARYDDRKVVFSSPVTGDLISNNESPRSPAHWVQNMVQSVKFSDALRAMILGGEDGKNTVDTLIEVGPHGALQGYMRQILAHPSLKQFQLSIDSCLKRNEDAVRTMQGLAGRLYCQNYPVRFEAINFPQGHDNLEVITGLPIYQWNHTMRYWAEPQRAREAMRREYSRHDLLGVKIDGPVPGMVIWRNTIRIADLPWLQHHLLQSECVFPGAGLATMVVDAMRQLGSPDHKSAFGYMLSDIELYNALVIPNTSQGVVLQLIIQDQSTQILNSAPKKEFSFYSQDVNGNRIGHCNGKVTVSDDIPKFAIDKQGILSKMTPIDISHFYNHMKEVGPNLGPNFQNISYIARGDKYAEATITIPDTLTMLSFPHQSDFCIHPTILDACFQVSWAAVPESIMNQLGLCIPRFAKSVVITSATHLPPGSKLYVYASLTDLHPQGFEVSLSVVKLDGCDKKLIMQANGLKVRSLSQPKMSEDVDHTVILRPLWRVDDSNSLTNGASNSYNPLYPKATVLISLSNSDLGSESGVNELAKALHSTTGTTVSIEKLESSVLQGKACIIIDDLGKNFLSSIGAEVFDLLRNALLEADSVLWVSHGFMCNSVCPEASIHVGLLRTLRMEERARKYISLDLNTAEAYPGQTIIQAICATFSRCMDSFRQDDHNYEISYRSEHAQFLHYERYLEANEEYEVLSGRRQVLGRRPWFSDQYTHLKVERPGILDSLVFEQDYDCAKSLPWTEEMVEIVPHAFGLNFRDVLVAMGEMKENWMGFECAGYISRVGSKISSGIRIGDRVCCLMQSGNWANAVRVPWTSVMHVPAEMTMELAASIPMCFVTAFYSIVMVGQLEAGEVILIHGAAGGVGQAAITIAHHIGAKIFATASTDEKRTFLKENYGIPRENIFSSRHTAFRSEIMRATGGRGADMVLNSLAGPLLQASWECIADCGRFIELGKRDSRLGMALQMENFGRAASYVAVDIVQLGIRKPKTLHKAFRQVMDMFEKQQIIHKMPITPYSIQDLQKAFRCLQSGKNIGKVVVRVREDEQIQTIVTPEQVTFDPNASYLIVGGVSGLGLELARWMSLRGAKHLIPMSRNAAKPENRWICDDLQGAGTEVGLCSCDVTDKADLERAINRCRSKLPIRGVVQAAAVLQDSIFENMTHQQWQGAVGPKVIGTKNLHDIFQDPDLQFFITLSSTTAILGNVGQANYTAGGAYQDALAHKRVSEGIPAVSINIGSVSSTGLAARAGVGPRLEKAGYQSQTLSELLCLMEMAIRHPYHGQMITGIKPWSDPGDLMWRLEPRFACLHVHGDTNQAAADGPSELQISLKDRLNCSSSSDESISILVEALKERLADTFGRSASEFDADVSPSTYGIDSLVAVELRNWLITNVTSKASIFDITQSSSITDLAKRIQVKLS